MSIYPRTCPQSARKRRHRPGATTKTRANKRPQKRPHRTVSRAWLLSKQERKNESLHDAGGGRNGQAAIGQAASRFAVRGRKAQKRIPPRPVSFRCGPLLAPVSDAFRFIFRSKFKAQKTAPSHGFRGLAAIKQIAKRCLSGAGGENRRTVLAIRSCARACRPGRGAAAGCPIGLAWRHQRPEGAASRRRRRAARAPRAGRSRPGG